MGKFNEKSSISRSLENRADAVLNVEGGLSFEMDPCTKLYTLVATAMVNEQTFYKSAGEKDSDLKNTIKEVMEIDPMFVLKLAYYTRTKLYMRSVTTLLLNEFANSRIPVDNARKWVTACIQRPDDMTELIALSLGTFKGKGKLPMVIKNGVKDAFPVYDSYRLAKYNRDDSVKLRDVMFLTHPKPRDEAQKATWSKLIDGTLESPDTWEVMRSTGKMSWQSVLHDVFNKGGKTNNYFAIIRNIRNLVNAGLSVNDMDLLCSMIRDEKAIQYSKVLPFRYLSAYTELRNGQFGGQDLSDIYEALEDAVQISINNVPKLSGETLVAIDTSGSMSHKISDKSTVSAVQIAAMLGMMSRRVCERSRTVLFDTRTRWQNLPDKDILRNAYEIATPGGATYGNLVLKDVINQGLSLDRMIFLTDMVLYTDHWGGGADSFATEWTKYQRSPIGKNCKLINVDLVGYGLSTVHSNMKNTRTVAGWSDQLFSMINALENSSNAVDEISRINLAHV